MSNEEKARRMGWVPKEDFRGDPEKWVDADTFVDRGENMIGILKENLDRMDGKLEKSEQAFVSLKRESSEKIDKLTNTIEKFAQFHKQTAQRSYQRALKDLKGKMRDAAASGDVAAFDAVSKEMDDLADDVSQKDEPQPKGQDGYIDPDFPAWLDENPWYRTEDKLIAYANHIAPGIAQANPNLRGKAFMDEVKHKVVEAYPEKFENPKKKTPPAVEGGGVGDADSKKRGKGWSDLPKDAKDAYTENFSDIKGFSKEQYAKDYWAQEEV